MKKLLILAKDISSNGGGERVGVNLANELCKYYDLEFVSFFKENEKPHFNLNENIKTHYISKLKSRNFLYKFFMKSIYRYILSLKICFFIRRQNFDFILANDGFFVPFFKNKHTRYIRLWHLQAPKRKKKIFAKLDTLVILSKKELSTWQSYHKDIRIIPNFLSQIPEQNANLKQKKILSIGRMDRGDPKGFFRLLELFKLVLADENLRKWKLCIVGDGILKESLKARVKELGLCQNIEIKDFTKNIENEYLNASIYVMTSYFEGFGMVLAEASSYALPCIAFDVNAGPSDIIDDDKTGFLIEDKNLKAYAKKLSYLMKDENLRANFAKNAKQKAKEFSKEKIIKEWIELLS